MNHIKEKRYRLEKLINKDEETGLETWKFTNMWSDDLNTLSDFLATGYRIFDILENLEVRRNC